MLRDKEEKLITMQYSLDIPYKKIEENPKKIFSL